MTGTMICLIRSLMTTKFNISSSSSRRGDGGKGSQVGTWHFMPSSAETYQDFVPARIADNGKVVPINGAWVPAGIRRVMLPGQPTTVDQCRPDLLRVSTNLEAGLWGLRLDTRTNFWYGRVEGLPELVTLAPFEVTP